MTDELILEKLADHDEQLEFIREHMILKDDFREKLAEMVTREEFYKEMSKMVTLEEFHKEMANVVTKEEFYESLHSFRSEMLHGQDDMMTILLRLDQERVFTNERIQRIEEKIA